MKLTVALRRSPEPLRNAVQLAVDLGWRCEMTRKGHVRLRPPPEREGEVDPVVFPSTPSDHRGYRNTIAVLRRSGVPVPHHGRGT